MPKLIFGIHVVVLFLLFLRLLLLAEYTTTTFDWDNAQTSNLLNDLTPTFMYAW